jgi:hypothetical protein
VLREAGIVQSPVHSGRWALRLEPRPTSAAGQRVAVSPGARYRVSAWATRGGLVPGALQVRASFLDDRGETVVVSHLSLPAGPRYTYGEGALAAPEAAVGLKIVLLGQNAAGQPTFVDDVRVLDANLLTNGDFEEPAPTGRDDEAPGWRFEAAGARVVTEAAHVRSGDRAIALDGLTEGYRQLTQEIAGLPGAARYRVSAWLKAIGADMPLSIVARFDTGGNQVLVSGVAQGGYRFVSREVVAPAGAGRLTIRVRLGAGPTGTAYVDDVLVEPLDPPEPDVPSHGTHTGNDVMP